MPDKMRVSDCLREFQTGGLRRTPFGKPFGDLIPSERTSKRERRIANHPSIKPQSFFRQIVYASLPMGSGLIADPFMGSGSTVAAAEATGLTSIGVELFADYYKMAVSAVPKLAALNGVAEVDGLFGHSPGWRNTGGPVNPVPLHLFKP
jgi:site-specific DNA-methyltransferase (adenine-specific)